MAAMEPLCQLIGINSSLLSKRENLILEAVFFERLSLELKDFFINQHKDYFRILKIVLNKEKEMIETSLIRWMVQDVLSTEQYDLKGIAYYTGASEEEIQELYIGRMMNPSIFLFRGLVELHKSVRPDLYRAIMKKITIASV